MWSRHSTLNWLLPHLHSFQFLGSLAKQKYTVHTFVCVTTILNMEIAIVNCRDLVCVTRVIFRFLFRAIIQVFKIIETAEYFLNLKYRKYNTKYNFAIKKKQTVNGVNEFLRTDMASRVRATFISLRFKKKVSRTACQNSTFTKCN
jgi:hypothetical protein